MIRFFILFGFTLMFVFIRSQGNLNKYINTKYSYLSTIAIVLFALFTIIEFVRLYRAETAAERMRGAAQKDGTEDGGEGPAQAHPHGPDGHVHDRRGHDRHVHDGQADHVHAHAQVTHAQDAHHGNVHDTHVHDGHHEHVHHDHDGHADGHSHESRSRWKRVLGRAVLFVPIFTGIFLPVQTLDSSFVKAKGFSFPQIDVSDDNPGQHQFLRPDTSVYYGAEGYAEVKNKEYAEFKDLQEIHLTDENYLKGMEVIYNFPGNFMGRTVSFDGFAYRGEQADGNHYFIFRFGFIHCAADSGVFGMLADFPSGTQLANDQWVHITGTLTSELYQPFKQTIPVLKVTSMEKIPAPEDPYVYRNY